MRGPLPPPPPPLPPPPPPLPLKRHVSDPPLPPAPPHHLQPLLLPPRHLRPRRRRHRQLPLPPAAHPTWAAALQEQQEGYQLRLCKACERRTLAARKSVSSPSQAAASLKRDVNSMLSAWASSYQSAGLRQPPGCPGRTAGRAGPAGDGATGSCARALTSQARGPAGGATCTASELALPALQAGIAGTGSTSWQFWAQAGAAGWEDVVHDRAGSDRAGRAAGAALGCRAPCSLAVKCSMHSDRQRCSHGCSAEPCSCWVSMCLTILRTA